VSGQVTVNVYYLLYDGGVQQARIRQAQAQAQAESARQNLAPRRALQRVVRPLYFFIPKACLRSARES
jgi:outer membrane protein TolC